MCHAAWYLNPPQHCPRTRISERLLLCTERLSHGHSHHLLPRGYTVTLALRVWVCLTSYCTLTLFKGSLVSGGRAPDLLEGSARLLAASRHVSPLRNTAVWCR